MRLLLLCMVAVGLLTGLAAPARAEGPLPENDRVRVVAAQKTDCFIYQADCLRITVECKTFLVLGTPVLEVVWRDPDGSVHYDLVKHITGGNHCSPGDLIQRYVPWFEGKRYELTLP